MKVMGIKSSVEENADRDKIINFLIDLYNNGDSKRVAVYDDEGEFTDVQNMCSVYRDCSKAAMDKIVRERGCKLPYQEVPRLLDISLVNDHLEIEIDRSEKTWDFMKRRTVEYKEERKRDSAEKMAKRFGENGVYSWRKISLGLPKKDGWCIVKDSNGEYAMAKYINDEWVSKNPDIDVCGVVAWRYLNPTNIK